MEESGVLKERRGFVDRRRVSSVVSSFKGDPHKPCIHSSDSATYMSYLKITRKQLQLVKRIKQSGDGIKSKSLNCILGDINRFQVHPYKILEEEERKKLHEQWLQLASRDLPSTFSYWTEIQLQRQQWRRSLEQEMAQKKFFMLDKDEGKGNPDSSLEDQINNGVTYYEVGVVMQTSVDEEESAQHIINSRPFQRIPSLNSQQELKSIVRELQEGSRDIFKPEGASPMLSKFFGNMNPMEELEIPVHSAKESVPYSTNSRFLQQIPSLSGHHELDPMDVELDDGNQHILKPEGAVPKFFGNTNPTNGYVEWEGLVPSAKDAWLEVGTTNSYFHPTSETTASELSLGQSHPIREQPAHLIDLETDMVDQDAEEALLNRPSNNLVSAFRTDTRSSFYGPYTNQDCNEFLQPFLKVHGMLPSKTHRHKQLGSQYLSTNNGSRSDHHPGHFQEQQQQLLEQRQQISTRDFMYQGTHKDVYSSGGRYPHPNQEIFSPVGMQNLSANPVLVQAAPLQAYSNSRDLLDQNCFPDQHQACGSSSEVDASSILGQCLGNRSNADESLYNVLSRFSTKLQSHSSYNSTRVAEQDVAVRIFQQRQSQ